MYPLIPDHGGFHGDLNATYPVGKADQESLDLIATTKKAMEEAIAICKPGVAYREIGNMIESITKPKGYSVVRRYTGHGIHHLVSFRPVPADESFIVNLISSTMRDPKHLGKWK
jgi:methionyl aminopeptidase